MDVPFLASCVLTWLLAFTSSVNTFHRASAEIQCADSIVSENEGVITSPAYPEKYPNHISCTWHITGNIGEVVTILFEDLDIEESGYCEEPPCCVYNWVKIGPSLNGTERQYCGRKGLYRPTFVSSFNKVWIKFHISSVVHAGRGFKLYFTIGTRQTRSCKNDDFRCGDSKCIQKLSRCNGVNECHDGSDEKYCSDWCPSRRSCDNVFLCYDKDKHCNGIVDCPDYSDEIGCGSCAFNESRCGSDSSQCYNPATQRCNRIMDCLNGADEKDCGHRCPGKIACASGVGCYTIMERCNGVAQCTDSSDEKNCGSDLCNYERGGFLCGNGRCIREIWKCDRTNDCGDGTDEHNCLRNSVLTAAVMGSLICALLLVIAISCTCKLYALRSLEHQMGNRETVLHRMSSEFLFREPPPSYAVAVGEHQRGLCVENIHYNPPVRRGRRRPRRARRSLESRRASVSTLDGSRTQNCFVNGPQMNFTFPCAPPLPHLSARSPSSPANSNSQSEQSTSTGISILSRSSSSSDSENRTLMLDGGESLKQSLQERLKELPKDELKTELVKDCNVREDIESAESSFCIARVEKTDECADDNLPMTVCSTLCSSPLAFSEDVSNSQLSAEENMECRLLNSQTENCDNDLEPLIH